MEMYSAYNGGKSVVAERFIGTLRNKIDKNMTAVPKNVNFDVLIHIVDQYKNKYHRTIKIKPIDFKSDSYAEYNVDSNEKAPNSQVGDHVKKSKYRNIFATRYVPNCSEEGYVSSKIKKTVPCY